MKLSFSEEQRMAGEIKLIWISWCHAKVVVFKMYYSDSEKNAKVPELAKFWNWAWEWKVYYWVLCNTCAANCAGFVIAPPNKVWFCCINTPPGTVSIANVLSDITVFTPSPREHAKEKLFLCLRLHIKGSSLRKLMLIVGSRSLYNFCSCLFVELLTP